VVSLPYPSVPAPMLNTPESATVSSSSSSHPNLSGTGTDTVAPQNVFSEEKLRGLLTSVASGGISGGLNMALVSTGISPALGAFLALYVTGSILGYIFDIVFAKKEFFIPQGYGRGGSGQPYRGFVPYTDFVTRFVWLLRSFVGKYFFRYIITVLIDSLIGIMILNALIIYMNDKEFLMDFAYRDALAAGAIAVFTFILYNNILRFDWAYSNVDNSVINIMVLMWCTLVLTIFSLSFNRQDKKNEFNAGISDNLNTDYNESRSQWVNYYNRHMR